MRMTVSSAEVSNRSGDNSFSSLSSKYFEKSLSSDDSIIFFSESKVNEEKVPSDFKCFLGNCHPGEEKEKEEIAREDNTEKVESWFFASFGPYKRNLSSFELSTVSGNISVKTERFHEDSFVGLSVCAGSSVLTGIVSEYETSENELGAEKSVANNMFLNLQSFLLLLEFSHGKVCMKCGSRTKHTSESPCPFTTPCSKCLLDGIIDHSHWYWSRACDYFNGRLRVPYSRGNDFYRAKYYNGCVDREFPLLDMNNNGKTVPNGLNIASIFVVHS